MGFRLTGFPPGHATSGIAGIKGLSMQTAAVQLSIWPARSSRRNRYLSIDEAFIQGNERIEIISGNGRPTPVPPLWNPILRDSDVLVLVPDMHMFIYPSLLDNFKFGAESMLDFLEHADSLRQLLSRRGIRFGMYQLGDMFELCFPHPSFNRAPTVSDVRASHPIYGEILRLFTRLGCRYIMGNHDSVSRDEDGCFHSLRDGSVYMEHGYSADEWFRFTNPDHRHWGFSMKALRGFRRLESRVHRIRRRRAELDELNHSAIGVSSGDLERRHLPDPRAYPRRHLSHFTGAVRKATTPPRVCVIAHTHHPYLDPNFADGECIYVDAGAWTEGRSDFAVITNSEIAVCRYRRTTGCRERVAFRAAG